MKDIAPMVICLAMMMIPIVAILTTHQRKMAALIHGKSEGEGILPSKNAANNGQAELIQEIRQLRAEVASLTIAVDDMRDGSLRTTQRSGIDLPALRG